MGVTSLVWSHRKPSQPNNLRFFSQLLLTTFSPCLPITSAGSGHIFSIPHGKTEVIAVKHMQGQASCWGELTQCTATKAKETFTPKPGSSDTIQLHYPCRNNDQGTSAAGEPVVLAALPALARTAPAPSNLSTTGQCSATQELIFVKTVRLMTLPAISKKLKGGKQSQ